MTFWERLMKNLLFRILRRFQFAKYELETGVHHLPVLYRLSLLTDDIFYKQLGSLPSHQSCLHFQDFQSS